MGTLWIRVVDADLHPLADARVRAVTLDQRQLDVQLEDDCWIGHAATGEQVTIYASSRGLEPETHTVRLRGEVTQVVIGLRRPGQLSYSYGDDRLAFSPVDDVFLMQVRGARAAAQFRKLAEKHKIEWQPVSPPADTVADSPTSTAAHDLFVRVQGDLESVQGFAQELARSKLDTEISRVIAHGDRPPLGLTRELVVRFQDDVKRPEAEKLAASVGLRIVRALYHAGNGFVLERDGGVSYDLLKAADGLAQSGRVVYVEPNLQFVIEPDQYTPTWSPA
jgi:hypothetical protein